MDMIKLTGKKQGFLNYISSGFQTLPSGNNDHNIIRGNLDDFTNSKSFSQLQRHMDKLSTQPFLVKIKRFSKFGINKWVSKHEFSQIS